MKYLSGWESGAGGTQVGRQAGVWSYERNFYPNVQLHPSSSPRPFLMDRRLNIPHATHTVSHPSDRAASRRWMDYPQSPDTSKLRPWLAEQNDFRQGIWT